MDVYRQMHRVKHALVAGLALGTQLALGASSAHAQAAQSLPQGWTEAQRHYFYRTTQGSRLIRYDLFTKIESATDAALGCINS
ncbi:MAG: hypothetical protein RL701_3430 [Pseudomonadota bacterium]|jgi:Spy/CpxP family protein refolding chaperone